MTGAWYNGYSWKQRDAILRAVHRGEAGPDHRAALPCGLCGDPARPPAEWHSEDYSQPYSFVPPQSYPLCKACHGRLHKRFNRQPEEWELFCRHVDAGGYGREFAAIYPVTRREALILAIQQGDEVAPVRIRSLNGRMPWWQALTLDPESLIAAWARPRPLRARPHTRAYQAAITQARPTPREVAMLSFHARAPRRTVTMRLVATEILNSSRPSDANLAYGRLASRIGRYLDWIPDSRSDNSLFWMSVIAEGWQPPNTPKQVREYELVMIPDLVALFG